MKNVYFKKLSCSSDKSQIARDLLVEVLDKENIVLKNEVPIKVHFGEKGNITYIKPDSYDGIIDLLEENNLTTSFIETNVLYVGSRTTKERHIKTAKEHNFTRVPIIIADGELGDDIVEIEINQEFFKTAIIGKECDKVNQIIVCSHFKGHGLAGFGGALKQLAMGFAARRGKLAMHSLSIPKINTSNCTACGVCEANCPPSAISIDEYAVIDPKKCIGCAACISNCPENTIGVDWGNNPNFLEKVAEYALAAQKGKENVYITFVSDVTDNCDCIGIAMEPVIKEIGIIASTDPVALDRACLDLVIAEKDTAPDSKLWNYILNGEKTLEHSEKIGLGSRKYNLIEK